MMELTKKQWEKLFSDNLIEVMDCLGYSTRQLSRETGIAYSSLRNYINCVYSPSITSLVAIAQAMRIECSALLEPMYGLSIRSKYDYYDEPISELDWTKDFSFMLKSILKSEQCSQSELAENTGISQGLISKYLHGNTIPSAYAVIKIFSYLDLVNGYDEYLDLGMVVIGRI